MYLSTDKENKGYALQRRYTAKVTSCAVIKFLYFPSQIMTNPDIQILQNDKNEKQPESDKNGDKQNC